MKILYHHRTLSKDGQDVHVQEIVRALSQRGHEVIFVGPHISRHSEAGSRETSSRLRAWLPRAVAELLELAYSVFAYVRLLLKWWRHRPDVLYERYNLFLMSGLWLGAQTKIPFLLEINAPLYDERRLNGGLYWTTLARRCEGHVWRHADAVLPVTSVLAGKLCDENVDKKRIHVIANGVNSDRFPSSLDGKAARHELNLDGKLVLGFTGFIRPWHGLVRVVEAIANLPNSLNLHFLVVGDGPGRAEIEDRARVLGVAHRVTFLGVVDHDTVGFYISAFDIALQPHAVAYASPLKLFEYMALGRAIVAPDQANIREVLTHERDALLFDPADEQSFSGAVTRLCIDPTLRQSLGTGALRTIEMGHYRWSDNAARIEEIALGLLDRAKGRAAKSDGAALSAHER